MYADEGFEEALENEVVGSYLLDIDLKRRHKHCTLFLSNGVFEYRTPYEVFDSDGNPTEVESLIGYAIEFASDIWDDDDNDNSRIELVFDSGSKICAYYLQWSDRNSEYDEEKHGKELDSTIHFTSKDGDHFSAGMMYI